jgi:RimK family alpha-L-glutamate ligase
MNTVNSNNILVLFGGQMSDHLTQIKEELKKRGENACFGNYKELIFKSGSIDQTPIVTWRGIDLNQFRVIFFRLIGARWEIITLINLYLQDRIEEKKVILIDPLAKSLKRYLGLKLSQVMALQNHNLPTPQTFWGYLEEIQKLAGNEIGFPMIIKRSGGSHGTRVHLAKSQLELNKIISQIMPQETVENKRFIAQEFIPNHGDVRVLVLDNQALGGIKRMRSEDEFRNNVSRGGKAEALKELPQELAEIAVKSAAAVDLSFAGVDIVEHQDTGKHYVLEINRSPQFSGFMKATGMNVPAKLAEFLIKTKDKTHQ